jgi:hypothetical protein
MSFYEGYDDIDDGVGGLTATIPLVLLLDDLYHRSKSMTPLAITFCALLNPSFRDPSFLKPLTGLFLFGLDEPNAH